MEKDDELKGEGNSYDFGARMLDPRVGRWFSADKMKSMAPEWSPYRFAFDNPMRYKDSDGNWEEDGHFWTVYAMGIAMGLKKSTARILAQAAEKYDHEVMNNNSMKITPRKSYLFWGSDGGLGTWADPALQKQYHGLTGGLQKDVLNNAINEILSFNILKLHTLGDSWAHSYMKDGIRVMYGAKGNNEPSYALFARAVLGDITFEHAMGGPEHGKHADNIADRSVEYMLYVKSLSEVIQKLMPGDQKAPDLTIFKYVKQNGKTKKNNIFLLNSYIELQSGKKQFNMLNNKQFKLLKGYLDLIGTEYRSKSNNTTKTDSSGKEILKIENNTIIINK